MGINGDSNFARCHHVLNRAVWSPLRLIRILLLLLMERLDHGDGPLVSGIDETLERRRGKQIKVRRYIATRCGPAGAISSSHPISLMWLTNMPVGTTDVGIACADRPGSLRALLPATGADSKSLPST